MTPGGRFEPVHFGPVRMPAAAGQFYPADPDELRRELARCFAHPLGPGGPGAQAEPRAAPLAIISPHAGLRYSGPVAAHAYSRLGPARTAIVLGPNHHGLGSPLAMSPARAWHTPLGDLPTDLEVAQELRAACPELQVDGRAHLVEHSIELQAVFLRYVLGPEARLVAIAVGAGEYADAAALGRALAVTAARHPVLLVASTDLSHYLPDAAARERDARAIAAIERLDVAGLIDLLREGRATLCGPAPTLAVLLAARELGATSATLLRYCTSADTGGGAEAVVGYAALRIDYGPTTPMSEGAPDQRK